MTRRPPSTAPLRIALRKHAFAEATSRNPSIGIPFTSTTAPRLQQTHWIHTLNASLTKKFQNGIPGLLSSRGVKIAWNQYQAMMVDTLNDTVKGTTLDDVSVRKLISKTSRNPGLAIVFNAASMAHNNEFFFTGIKDPSEIKLIEDAENTTRVSRQRVVPSVMPDSLHDEITKQFDSVETFRSAFMAMALGMFGPGFVWLGVSSGTGRLNMLATYLAGSPYAKHKRQGIDNNTNHTTNDLSPYYNQQIANNTPGAHDINKKVYDSVRNTNDLQPILCFNTWPHVWLTDYGMYNVNPELPEPGTLPVRRGIEVFYNHWWDVVDWGNVETLKQSCRKFR